MRITVAVCIAAMCWLFALSAPAAAANWHEMLSSLAAETGAPPEVRLHAATGQARFLRLERPSVPLSALIEPDDATVRAGAMDFLAAYGPLFGLSDPAKQLSRISAKRSPSGGVFQKFQQRHQGIPVFCGQLVVQSDALGRVLTVSGEIASELNLPVAPAIAVDAARQTALELTAKHQHIEAFLLTASEPELTVYDPRLIGDSDLPSSLVFKVVVTAEDAPIREIVLVDAHKGFVALNFNQVPQAKTRTIYDKNNNSASTTLPGTAGELARSEGGAVSGIADVDDAYDYLGLTYDFYADYHGRDSIDGAGMGLVATTRYCPDASSCPYANAYWNGSQMVFGDGYASALDVVAHELTHGVTENESGLIYLLQSGAINESLSDVWGETIELTYLDASAEERWLMGEDLGIGAIRDMANPPIYGDPDSMSSALFYCYGDDQGGVHTNSGVGNKAYALAVDGGSFNGQTVTGLGLGKAVRIWYRAATFYLTQASEYDDLADALRSAAQDLVGQYGITSADVTELGKALIAVAMDDQPAACPRVDSAVCPSGRSTDVFYDDLENLAANWTPYYEVGSNQWYLGSYPTSGSISLYGYNPPSMNDSSVISPAIDIPAGGKLHFNHAFAFECDADATYDGGVVEYSTDNGANWHDAGDLFRSGGYNGQIDSNWGNPLAGHSAFVGSSGGYMSSRLDLSSLAGQTVRFRFRVTSDTSVDAFGWTFDDMRVYTCSSSNTATLLLLLF